MILVSLFLNKLLLKMNRLNGVSLSFPIPKDLDINNLSTQLER